MTTKLCAMRCPGCSAPKACLRWSFASGEALLAAFDVERIGCLVLDVRMAPINGLALFEKLLASQPLLPASDF